MGKSSRLGFKPTKLRVIKNIVVALVPRPWRYL
jgi:hypothetical protein